METKTKKLWSIIHPDGTVMFRWLNDTRKYCILNFLEGTGMSWAECRKLGWDCKKVKVNFEFI